MLPSCFPRHGGSQVLATGRGSGSIHSGCCLVRPRCPGDGHWDDCCAHGLPRLCPVLCAVFALLRRHVRCKHLRRARADLRCVSAAIVCVAHLLAPSGYQGLRGLQNPIQCIHGPSFGLPERKCSGVCQEHAVGYHSPSTTWRILLPGHGCIRRSFLCLCFGNGRCLLPTGALGNPICYDHEAEPNSYGPPKGAATHNSPLHAGELDVLSTSYVCPGCSRDACS
jgi:hypothetical protein